MPKLRQGSQPFALGSAWFAGKLWMTGVLRCFANVNFWPLMRLAAGFPDL
jgi:hypothetical protein